MMSQRRWFSVLALTTLIGCIAFVDQSPTGDQFSTTCTLADSTSACGSCAAQSCAAELTACCAHSACRRALDSFDRCADGGTCAVDVTEPSANALAKCLDSSCRSSCDVEPATIYDAGASVSCSVDTALGDCFCSTSSLGGGSSRCDITTVPNAICCADYSWPQSGSCTCSSVKCETDSFGNCTCSTFASGSAAECSQSTSGVCCADYSSCNCDLSSNSCGSTGTQVANCALAANVGCGGQRKVTTCSPTVN